MPDDPIDPAAASHDPAGAPATPDLAADAPRVGRNGKPVRPLIAGLAERRAVHKRRSIIIRALYLVASLTVLLAGLAMLITPGPAFVVIPIGLTLLALEFASAERALDYALDQADAAKKKARETTPTERALAAIATGLAIAAAVAAAIYWDIPYLPV